MSDVLSNFLPKDFDPANYQWQDQAGRIFKLEDLSRADLLQVACSCMEAIEIAQSLSTDQQRVFEAWSRGKKPVHPGAEAEDSEELMPPARDR